MKTLTVYCDKDLVFRWNEWPEKPNLKNFISTFPEEYPRTDSPSYSIALLDYQEAIEVAKRESIACEDQHRIKTLLNSSISTPKTWYLKPDTFYSFPFDGEVKMSCNRDCPEVEYGACCHPSNCCKLARIIPESKEESQEEILRDVFQRLYDCLERGHGSMKSILNDFSITRKHP